MILMKKIVLFVIILLVIICIFGTNNYKSMKDRILDAINNKGDINVYFTDNSDYLNDRAVNAVRETYNVDIKEFNINAEGKKNLKILNKRYNYMLIDGDYLGSGSLISVRNGIDHPLNGFAYEVDVCDFFKNNKVIKKDKCDIYIRTDEEFEKLYNSDGLNLIVVYNPDEAGYRFRSKIHELHKEYKFKYHIVTYHYGNVIKSDGLLDEDDLIDKVNLPILFIVSKGKIVDYIDKDNSVLISDFLKKHKVIK